MLSQSLVIAPIRVQQEAAKGKSTQVSKYVGERRVCRDYSPYLESHFEFERHVRNSDTTSAPLQCASERCCFIEFSDGLSRMQDRRGAHLEKDMMNLLQQLLVKHGIIQVWRCRRKILAHITPQRTGCKHQRWPVHFGEEATYEIFVVVGLDQFELGDLFKAEREIVGGLRTCSGVTSEEVVCDEPHLPSKNLLACEREVFDLYLEREER